MYEERNNKLSIRDIVIQLSLVILFVLILIWLFPTKGYLENNFVKETDVSAEISEQLKALYGRLFADNVDSMKNAAKDYFTTPRLPKNVGDSVTLTLGDMLDKKLVLPLKDSNNESCDATKSYVQLTKMDDEYQMKVQLTCSDYSDYIIVHMGCYNYCDSAICETKKPETPVVKPTPKPTPKPDPKPDDPKPVVKKYEYEYIKYLQNTYSDWSPWSSWSTTSKAADNLTQVEKKTEQVLVNDGKGWGIIGYKTVPYTVYETVTKYKQQTSSVLTGYQDVITGYDKILTGYKTTNKLISSYAQKYNQSNGYYTNWVSAGTVEYPSTKKVTNTTTTTYSWKSSYTVAACKGCASVTYVVYNVSTRKYVSGSNSAIPCTTSYGAGYVLENGKCNKYQTVQEPQYKQIPRYTRQPVYKNVTTSVPYQTTEAVTKYRQEAVYGEISGQPSYQTVTYYRYRTRTQTGFAGEDKKWSSSQSDSSLLNNGYRLTGNSREV